MAQKTITIECTGEYTFSYDNESEEFKESLAAYQDVIEKNGSEESMIMHCAHNLRRTLNVAQMVEGVGYIQKEGWATPKKLFSGITVEEDDPDFEYNKA